MLPALNPSIHEAWPQRLHMPHVSVDGGHCGGHGEDREAAHCLSPTVCPHQQVWLQLAQGH